MYSTIARQGGSFQRISCRRIRLTFRHNGNTQGENKNKHYEKSTFGGPVSLIYLFGISFLLMRREPGILVIYLLKWYGKVFDISGCKIKPFISCNFAINANKKIF